MGMSFQEDFGARLSCVWIILLYPLAPRIFNQAKNQAKQNKAQQDNNKNKRAILIA